MKNKLYIIIIFAFLSLPFALLLTVGEAGQSFDGELDYKRPGLTAFGFLNRSFQTDFENWFSTKYPLRPAVVELYGAIEARKNFSFVSENGTIGGAALGEPRFPEYAPPLDTPYDPGGYRGNAQVVVGLSGYLYENGYINEYLGFAKKYTDADVAALETRARELKSIQENLSARNIAFLVLITPNKAASLPQYIPAWYTSRFQAQPDYVRPCDTFKELLDAAGVYYVDASEVLRAVGMTNTFPKTGTHWTKPAAFEATAAVIGAYERQTGQRVRNLTADRILSDTEPPGFGASETDILGVAYAGKRNELESAISDEFYYWPDAYVNDENLPKIRHVLLQGGSFTDDLAHYLTAYGLADNITSLRYNIGGNPEAADWESEIGKTSFVILEVNEQFVHNMGGNAPSFGQNDFLAQSPGDNIVTSLCKYLGD